MTNELPDPLEQMQKDWQQTETPRLSVEAIKRRLRWRWLHLGLDGVGLLLVAVILAWSLNKNSDVLGWVYWGFFFSAFVLATIVSIQMRLRALRRPDDSISAVMEHARRDANLRIQTGRLTIWMTLVIGTFVAIWMLIAGWQDPEPLSDFLGQRLSVLIFAVLWCAFAIAIGAWMRESGRRQHLELDHLDRELAE